MIWRQILYFFHNLKVREVIIHVTHGTNFYAKLQYNIQLHDFVIRIHENLRIAQDLAEKYVVFDLNVKPVFFTCHVTNFLLNI